MTLREVIWVGALLFTMLIVAWGAFTLGDPDEDKPRRPLPFPDGESPLKGYTGLHAEDGRTQRLSWPAPSPRRSSPDAGTGPSTTGLSHWVLPAEPRAVNYYQPAPDAPTLDQPGEVQAEHVDMSGELVRIAWPPEDHQPPAGWNEDADRDR